MACDGLKSVSIPSSVSFVGTNAFRGCQLESINVDEGNKVYDSRNNCNAIIDTKLNKLLVGCKNTVIPQDVQTIASGSFENIIDLESTTIPKSVTTIDEGAFAGCINLMSVKMPNTLDFANIAPYAFGYCYNINSIVITDAKSKDEKDFKSNGISENNNSDSISLPELTVTSRRTDTEQLSRFARIFGESIDIILYVPKALLSDYEMFNGEFLDIKPY